MHIDSRHPTHEIIFHNAEAITLSLGKYRNQMLRLLGQQSITAPTLMSVGQSDFSELLTGVTAPEQPVLLLCLPETLQDELDALANLEISLFFSRDLRTCWPGWLLKGSTIEISMPSNVIPSNDATTAMIFVLMCGDDWRFLGYVLPDTWRDSVESGQRFSANYCPEQVLSAELLAEASIDEHENEGANTDFSRLRPAIVLLRQ